MADIDVPIKHTVDVTATAQLQVNLEEYERLFGVDEDACEQPTTTRKELWSYYLYYNGMETSHRTREDLTNSRQEDADGHKITGDNGVGPGSYTQTL